MHLASNFCISAPSGLSLLSRSEKKGEATRQAPHYSMFPSVQAFPPWFSVSLRLPPPENGCLWWGKGSKLGSLMGNRSWLLGDPAGFSLCTVPGTAHPVLANLFQLLSAPAVNGPPVAAEITLLGKLGLSGEAPTRFPKSSYPPEFTWRCRSLCCCLSFQLSFSFAWVVQGKISESYSSRQPTGEWSDSVIRWNHSVLTVLALGKRRKLMGQEEGCFSLGNRTCRPLRTQRPFLPSPPSGFIDLRLEGRSAEWLYSVLLSQKITREAPWAPCWWFSLENVT